MNTASALSNSHGPTDPKHPTSGRRWLRVVKWIAGVIVLPMVVGAFVLLFLLQSTAFHRYLIDTVQSRASQAIGSGVHLQNFAVHLSTLSVDLYGITVDGASPHSTPPVLQIQHAEVGIGVTSMTHAKWYLDALRVDRPVVQIVVDKNGISNIPKFKSSGDQSSHTTAFDLGIRRAVLDGGEIYYNYHPSSLAVDLHNFEIHAAFADAPQRYSGTVAYADGSLAFGALQPPAHDFHLQFEATPTTFVITQAKLTSGSTQIYLDASLNNYNEPFVQANFSVTFEGSQIAQMLQDPSIPTGLVQTAGSLQYRQVAGRSALETLVVNADLTSPRLTIRTRSARAEVDKIIAHYSLAHGEVVLRDFRADVFGGELTAQGTMNNLAGVSASRFNASLRGVSLADVRRGLGPAAPASDVKVSGVLNADASASWGRTFDDLVAHTDATLDGQVTNRQANRLLVAAPDQGVTRNPAATAVIPVTSAIHATYTNRTHQFILDKTYLRTPQTNLTMDGIISDRSSLGVGFQANDLRELETIADIFQTTAQGNPSSPFDLAGTASFQGSVKGSTLAPHLTGQLAAQNLHFRGTALKMLRTGVDATPSMLSLQHAELDPSTGGRLTFNASTGLSKWSYRNTNPIQIELNATQIGVEDIARLAGQQVPVTGTLNATMSIHGTGMNPVGHGTIALTGVTAYDEPVTSARLTLSGSGDEAHADVAVQLPAGLLKGKVSVRPSEKSYDLQLASDGLRLNNLHALKTKGLDASGVLALDAVGKGTFDNPQLTASLKVPALTIHGQSISDVNLEMNVTDHVATATLACSTVNVPVQVKAKVNLSGDYLADASIDTREIQLQPLLAAFAPGVPADVSGQTEIHATLHGPLKNKDMVEAHVVISTLRMAYNSNIQLAAASPIHLDYKNGRVEVQRTAIKGTDTDLQLQGSIPITGTAPMSLLLLGTVNLQVAQLFDPDVRSSGTIKFNIGANGVVNGPNVGGQIEIVDANYASSDLPTGLQHGNGVLTLQNDRIGISKFQGTIGGGTLTAQGGVVLRPSIQFDMGVAAKGVRILYPQGMRESIDANLKLTGSTENAVLGGVVDFADLSFTQAFDLSNFISQFSSRVASPPTQGFSQNVALNLAVHSTNNVNLTSRTLSLDGSANLQLRGTAADPVILGRINLNSGDIILNGSRFVLNGGTVQFVNPSETQTVVNMNLSTTIQQYNIGLRFNGPIDQLRTQYSSDPALPQADIIHLLAFGKTTEASANSATSANQAAESLVASQVSSQVTSRISKIAGISQLSISPVLPGSGTQTGANITIQQRVTGNLFVTFSSNMSSTQGQTIQGQYQLSPRVAVSATRDPNGGFAVDALIKKSW